MSQSEKNTTLSFTESSDYSDCTITNIRRGKGERVKYIYAKLVDKNGNLLINADLDYIVEKISERLPGTPEDDNEL